MAVTNRGKKLMLDIVFRGASPPGGFKLALVTAASAPTVDTDKFASPLVEIAATNGYNAGGINLNRDSTDFDTLTEDDTNDKAILMIKDLIWTATGTWPVSGSGARYAILTGNDTAQTDRDVWAFWDLGSDRTMTAGQTFTLQNLEIDATE